METTRFQAVNIGPRLPTRRLGRLLVVAVAWAALWPAPASADWRNWKIVRQARKVRDVVRQKMGYVDALAPAITVPKQPPLRRPELVRRTTRRQLKRCKGIERLERRALALVEQVNNEKGSLDFNYDTWAGKRRLITARFMWAKALKLRASELRAQGKVEDAAIVERAARDYREATKKLEGNVLEFATKELAEGVTRAYEMQKYYREQTPTDEADAAHKVKFARIEGQNAISRGHKLTKLKRLAAALGRPVETLGWSAERGERRLRGLLETAFPTAAEIVHYVKAREAVLKEVTVRDEKGYLEPKAKTIEGLERDMQLVGQTLRKRPPGTTDPFNFLFPHDELGRIGSSMKYDIGELRSAEASKANLAASNQWFTSQAKGVLGRVAKGSKGLKNSGDRQALQKDLQAVQRALKEAPSWPSGPAEPAKRKLQALESKILKQLPTL